jgi:hypothetical protein
MAVVAPIAYIALMTTKLRSKLIALWPISKQQAAAAARASAGRTQAEARGVEANNSRPRRPTGKKA